MRPVDKDTQPLNDDGTVVLFPEYSRSRRYLIDAIGEYCSYCERLIPTSLAVEHIQPKTHNGHLELVWSNLLLACTNCNSTKGHTNVTLANYFWPDRDNTYEKLIYDISGIVKVNPILNAGDAVKSQNLISLVGLNRTQPAIGTANWEEASDRRYEHRLQAYIDANNYAAKYSAASVDERTIYLPFLIDIAKKGFWSIWMSAFEVFPEVQRELIVRFTGTRQIYF
ncbi:MAG: HNH endonuclease [Flavobacterium sp.]|nr:HNH endonuclease [Flavobacterium sp.]